MAAMMETPVHKRAALDELESVPKRAKRESCHSVKSELESTPKGDSNGNGSEYFDIPPPSPTEEIGGFAVGHQERAAFQEAVQAQQTRRVTDVRSKRSLGSFLRNQRDRRSFERRQAPEVNFTQQASQIWYYGREELSAAERAWRTAKGL